MYTRELQNSNYAIYERELSEVCNASLLAFQLGDFGVSLCDIGNQLYTWCRYARQDCSVDHANYCALSSQRYISCYAVLMGTGCM